MRSYFLVFLLSVLPAAGAAAQFGANPPQLPDNNTPPAGQQPAQAGEQPAAPNPMFAAIDTDGDGVINKVELRKAIKALKALDTDSDGNITLAEIGSTAVPAGAGGNPQVDQTMTEFDKNGDGKLTADEVPPHMMPMLQGADRNQDRAIDKDELSAALAQNTPPGRPGGALGPNGRGMDPRTGQFLRHDINSDGRLSREEIPRSMRGAFQAADDRDGDGFIDAAELQFVIARFGGAAQGVAAGAQPDGGFPPARDPNTFRDPNRRNRTAPENAGPQN
jgi:Ca2+-binding EF-hand superfamily protein